MTKPAMTAASTASSTVTDPFFAEVLTDPETRAAFEDAQARNNFVDTLVKLRRAMGLTQIQVAKRMGVKQPMLSGFENEGSDPRLSTIQRYARAVEATASFRLSMPVHCDWIPRTDSYASVTAESLSPVTAEPPSHLATEWARSKCDNFAPAA